MEESVGPPIQHDPEFEFPASFTLRPPLEAPETYLRIVANPFLGIFGFLGWLRVLMWVISLPMAPEMLAPMTPIIGMVFLGCLWVLPALFQYHCLDCGGTGRLSRWREHSCPQSAWRRQSGRGRLFRGPTPGVQLVLWFWGGLLFALLLHALGWTIAG